MKIIKINPFFLFFSKLNNVVKFFVLFSLFLFIPFSLAQALSSGGVGGYPANPDPNIPHSETWFIYNLDLGESKEDALLVFNTSDETKTVKLYAVDSVPSNQGNFALAPEDVESKDLGSWIKLSEPFITLEPGESKEIPFTITIPENADVGEHSGGIIIQKSNKAEALGQAGASIVTRVGIRVYETVPGEVIKKIELDEFTIRLTTPKDKEPFYEINLSVLNKSTVSLNPKVDLEIRGWGKIDYSDFKKINYESISNFITGQEKFPIHFFSGETLTKDWQLLRGQKVSTHWEWPKPEFGRFTFQVKLTYDSNDGPQTLATPTIAVWIIPWLELGVIGGIVGFIILLIVLKKLFSKTRKWQPYKVQKGDQLVILAEMHGVSWKKVAKVNKLKTPLLKEGQTVLLPPKSSNKLKPAKQPIVKSKNVK